MDEEWYFKLPVHKNPRFHGQERSFNKEPLNALPLPSTIKQEDIKQVEKLTRQLVNIEETKERECIEKEIDQIVYNNRLSSTDIKAIEQNMAEW